MTESRDLLPALQQLLGVDAVIHAPDAMARYLNDWRRLFSGNAQAVVRPANTKAVAAFVEFCHARGVGIVPQGGNTGLVGGATPSGDGLEIVLSLERLKRIRSVDAEDFSMIAEAGCILADIQAAAVEVNRYFPLSLGAEGTCQIGGNISTNAGGMNVLRYGNARELVLGLEVVLSDGSVWNDLRRVRKDNTGYALRQLLIGAEGTLGVITAACLRLLPLPRQRAAALVAVDDADSACALFRIFMRDAGEFVSSFEYMSGPSIDLAVEKIRNTRLPFATRHGAYALVELAATTATLSMQTVFETVLGPVLEERLALNAAIAPDEGKRAALWQLREAVVEAQRIGGVSIKHDVSVPISAVPDFLRRADEAVLMVLPKTRILPFGHLGDGNIHYNLMCPADLSDNNFRERAMALTTAVHDVVAEFGGSFSAEHGLGQLRRDEAANRKPEVERRLMREIKRAFDPGGILNRGKML